MNRFRPITQGGEAIEFESAAKLFWFVLDRMIDAGEIDE